MAKASLPAFGAPKTRQYWQAQGRAELALSEFLARVAEVIEGRDEMVVVGWMRK